MIVASLCANESFCRHDSHHIHNLFLDLSVNHQFSGQLCKYKVARSLQTTSEIILEENKFIKVEKQLSSRVSSLNVLKYFKINDSKSRWTDFFFFHSEKGYM